MGPPVYNPNFTSLAITDTVGAAVRGMLDARVADLPVVDAAGHLAGMFRLDTVLAHLLPLAARNRDGFADLAFVSDGLDELRERMQAIRERPVGDFLLPPAHIVRPDTSPVETILLLFRGQNNVPVVAADGRLVGMASAREILGALQS